MARAGNPSMFEQHIEKGVAGVAGLFLLYALLHWGLGSPISPPEPPPGIPAHDGLTIDKMDNWILNAVNRVEGGIVNYKPQPRPVPQYSETLKQMLSNPMPQQYLAMVDLSTGRVPTSMPGVGPQHEPIALADLANAAPATDGPKLLARAICPRKETCPDVNAAVGVIVYPWAELAKAWSEKLRNSSAVPSLVVQEVRVERQERQADGSWSNPKIVNLEPAATVEGMGGAVAGVPRVPDFDGKNYDVVRQMVEALRNPQMQQQILQPMYHDIYWQPTRQWVDWRINLPLTELSNTEGPALPAKKSEPILISSGTAGTVVPSGRPTVAPPSAMPEGMIDMGPGGSGGGGGEMMPTPTRRPGVTPKPTPAAPAEPQMQSLPLFAKQQEIGKVLVWFVDQTMDSGKVYRYRTCLRMVNPLLACANDVKTPADASSACVDTPWSAWSEPVSVSGSKAFFLTGAMPLKQEITVTIFSTALGQVVRQRASIRPGQCIGSEEKRKVANPGTGLFEERNVKFGTDAVVVNVDFNKTVVRGRIAEKTVEMLYLDASGQLQRRFMSTDLGSEEYRRLEQAAK